MLFTDKPLSNRTLITANVGVNGTVVTSPNAFKVSMSSVELKFVEDVEYKYPYSSNFCVLPTLPIAVI